MLVYCSERLKSCTTIGRDGSQEKEPQERKRKHRKKGEIDKKDTERERERERENLAQISCLLN